MEPTLAPYLNFGNTAEAMRFYGSVFGRDLTMQTFGEAKMAQTPEMSDLVVHAVLKSGAISLMASDRHPKEPAEVGDSVHMSIMGKDGTKLTKVFRELAAGGEIDMHLAKQF
jgi:PhnB protein